MKYLRTLRNNIYHSNKRGPPIFFHLDTNPVLGHVLIHSVDKTHVLVVTVELICLLLLNILSFKFVPTPNKQISTPCCCSNQTHKLHCFSFDGRRCAIQSNPVPFFFRRCLSLLIVRLCNLFLLSTAVAWMLFTPTWVNRRKDVKQLSMNILKLTVAVKHSISRRTTFSPNSRLEEATYSFFFASWYGL